MKCSLSNFKYLSIEFIPKYKTLKINFIYPYDHYLLTSCMIDELRNALRWLSEHIEITNVIISSNQDIFSEGMDHRELEDFSLSNIRSYYERLKEIIEALFYLPQIIIMDFKQKAEGLLLELLLAADIRIAHEDAYISFNDIEYSSISLNLLDMFVGPLVAKNWILARDKIEMSSLVQSGFIYQAYKDSREAQTKVLQDLSLKTPLTNMKLKMAITDILKERIDKVVFNIPCKKQELATVLNFERDHSHS